MTGSYNSPAAGGAWTLVTALSSTLKATQTEHEYVLLDGLSQPGTSLEPKGVRHVYAKLRRRKSYAERLQDSIDRYKLDIVWFTVDSAVPLRVPFIATVWDLEHRKQPYFPEVSVTGWTWGEREQTFRAVLPRASFIVTGTQVGKEEIVHYYGVNPNNVRVVPFPVARKELREISLDVPVVLEKYRIKGEFLLYPAQFWPHKNHIGLLRALDVLRRRDGLRMKSCSHGQR